MPCPAPPSRPPTRRRSGAASTARAAATSPAGCARAAARSAARPAPTAPAPARSCAPAACAPAKSWPRNTTPASTLLRWRADRAAAAAAVERASERGRPRRGPGTPWGPGVCPHAVWDSVHRQRCECCAPAVRPESWITGCADSSLCAAICNMGQFQTYNSCAADESCSRATAAAHSSSLCTIHWVVNLLTLSTLQVCYVVNWCETLSCAPWALRAMRCGAARRASFHGSCTSTSDSSNLPR